ncbi:unnamed protein product [Rotaria socialis]|uniref:CWH43-like N-terminal domain-containing protein n=1 Tax=Rotaria socialis TaxID=392032 RepID=A0A820Y645_9BILA|nr:unnamed protein product [Rotaria socialis]
MSKIFTIVLLIFTISTNIYYPIYRRLLDEDDKRIWSIALYTSNLRLFNYIIHTFHFLAPFVINLISAIVLITKRSRQKSNVHASQTFIETFKKIKENSHLLTAPVVVVILGIPRLIIVFLSKCIHISMSQFLWFAYIVPCFALFSCVSLSLMKDFEKSTRTHCNVTNFLPSISASISEYEPQRFIWRLCFALDSIPRYIIAYLRLNHLLNRHHIEYPEHFALVQIASSTFHFLELTFLLLLTYVSSREIKWIHEYSFISFMICSLAHMLLTVSTDYLWPRIMHIPLNEQEKSVRSKRLTWFTLNIVSISISFYFYYRHVTFCEPYIYSMFCLFEYIIVITNIAYHSVIMNEWDRQGVQIQFLIK